jgi:5'-nucleotidase
VSPGPDGHVTSARIEPPHPICAGEAEGNPMPVAQCQPGEYEGKPVVPDADVQKIVDEAIEHAKQRRDEKLGVTLTAVLSKSYSSESAVGNLFTDLMLAAQPGTQIALANGGGLRADLPAGELTYGQLYEAMPFDNRFAIVEMKGSHLRKLVSSNLQRGGGILSWSGLAAKAVCKGATLDVAITVGGKPLADNTTYKLVTSDFLASGGDGLIGRLKLPDGAIKMTDVIIRDAIADVLRKKKGKIDPKQVWSPTKKRLDFAGERPVQCGKPGRSIDSGPEEPD